MSKTRVYIYSAMVLFLGLSLVANAEGTNTSPSVVTSTSPTYVDAPTNLQAVAGYRCVIVTWKPSIAQVLYYRIEASSDGGKKWYAGPITRWTSYRLQNPTKKILIMYRVIAVGKTELSLPSNTATFILTK